MTESPSSSEEVPEAEDAAGHMRETLAELGERARHIVQELSRSAKQRREEAAARPAATGAFGQSARAGEAGGTDERDAPERRQAFTSIHKEADTALLVRRLDELRAGVGEVTDVLDATLERLETLEGQLGEPDEGVERRLRDGIERCERVLDGIEHRVSQYTASQQEAAGPASTRSKPLVLVVAASSRRRAAFCIALERQGLHTLAAVDVAQARAICVRRRPNVALVDANPSLMDATAHHADRRAALLETWKHGEDCGELPRALLLDADGSAAVFGFDSANESHGAAALAASLLNLAATDPGGRD